MFGTIALVVIGGIAAVLGYAATKPESYRVRRSTIVDAPPEKIFPLINDFHRWTEWSPWENIDADLKRNYQGAPSGAGAIYEWEGKKAGAGRMQIKESSSPTRIAIKLDFTKPFKSSNTTEFSILPKEGATEVTWDMIASNPFLGKVMCLFVNMDKMIGADFEKGLAKLKGVSESSTAHGDSSVEAAGDVAGDAPYREPLGDAR